MDDVVEEWPAECIDCKRYVGFMDVMGFKDMFVRHSHEYIGQVLHQMSYMKDMLQQLITTPFDDLIENRKIKGRVKSVTFSDSVLFVTKGDSLDDLITLSVVLAIFQSAAIQRGAPTKGAISFGRLTADFSKSIFYGQPLIDAYLLQEQLFYYGIILDNHVESIIINNLRSKDKKSIVLKGAFCKLQTPLKKGKVQHYNIRLKSLNDEQLEDMYKTVSGDTRKYVDNTIEIYHQMNSNKSLKNN